MLLHHPDICIHVWKHEDMVFANIPVIEDSMVSALTEKDCFRKLFRKSARHLIEYLRSRVVYREPKQFANSKDVQSAEYKELCPGRFDIPELSPSIIAEVYGRRKVEAKGDIDNKSVLTLLELPNDASASEVYQAVKKQKEHLAAMEAKLLQIEADEFVAANKERVFDPEGFKQLYIKYGKDVAERFLRVFTSQP